MKQPTKQNIEPSTFNLKHSFSYSSALLAATALIEKISEHCWGEPRIKGRLKKGKAKVKQIQIECIPRMQQIKRKDELVGQTINQVIHHLNDNYDLQPADENSKLPVSRLPSAISFSYMTIPTTIHFHQNEE